MALHPVGPLPASVYWRRRAGMLLVLLALLLLLRACAGGDAAPERTAATPTPTPTPSLTPSATASRAPTPTPVPVTTPPTIPAAPGLCPDGALAVTVTTDAETYPLGASPRITATVRNTGTAPCRRDLGSGAVELLVYSGADRVWSSDDCQSGTAVSLVTLPPGGTQAVVLTWSGKRSAPGCSGTRSEAKAGTYRAAARVGTLRQQGGVFRFRG